MSELSTFLKQFLKGVSFPSQQYMQYLILSKGVKELFFLTYIKMMSFSRKKHHFCPNGVRKDLEE